MEYQVDLREVLAVATSLSNSGPVIDREITTALTKSGLVVEGRAKELYRLAAAQGYEPAKQRLARPGWA